MGMLLDLGIGLTIPDFERSLNAAHPYQVSKNWHPKLSKEGLTVDLSRIEWIEPGALVMLVLLIEACVRNGFNVRIVPPCTHALDTESDILSLAHRTENPEIANKAEYIMRQIARRRAALESLARWRLWPILKAEHILNAQGKIWIDEEVGSLATVDISDKSAKRPQLDSRGYSTLPPAREDFTYRTIFPLHWVGDPHTDEGKPTLARVGNYDLLNFVTSVLNLPDRGISFPDAQTLAYVFLFELFENVIVHAGVPFGLMAVWARPGLAVDQELLNKIIRRDFRPSEREFAPHVVTCPVVEVVVGDSGNGIPAVLGPEFARWSRKSLGVSDIDAMMLAERMGIGRRQLNRNQMIMYWSLDKWSSSKPTIYERGTRGLYRVRRVVRKWQGQFTIRSERDLVGLRFESDGTEFPFEERKKLARFPGTVVHIRMPARSFTRTTVAIPSVPVKELGFSLVEFDSAVDFGEAEKKTVDKVMEQMKALPPFHQPSVTIVDLGFRPLDRHQLESLLTRFVQMAHPSGVVLANIGHPGWETLSEVGSSIGEKLIPTDIVNMSGTSYEPALVRNTVLVVEQSGKAKWIGHQEWLCSLLDELLEKNSLTREEMLARLPPTGANDQSLRDLFEQWHVIERIPDGGFRLRFNLADIIGQLRKRMNSYLGRLIQESQPPAVYRYPDRVFVTPSQRLVHSYICADDLLRTEEQRRTTMGLLALQIRLSLLAEGIGHSSISIVTDEGQARGLASSLRDHLGEAEVHPIPPYYKVGRLSIPLSIPSTHEVVVFTDLISTGSMVKSLAERLVQSNLTPRLIACVLDARENCTNYIHVNGIMVPVLSLGCVDLVPDKQAIETFEKTPISPISGRPEIKSAPFQYEISPDRLDTMVAESKAMYSGHIARSDWRHFTIYLDALRLLRRSGPLQYENNLSETGREICSAFKQVIDRWLGKNGIKKIDGILYPETLDEKGGLPTAAKTISQALGTEYRLKSTQIRIIPRRHGTTAFAFGDTSEDTWSHLSNIESPDQKGVRKNESLVLLDWGCITGQTAHQMLAHVAELEANCALVIFFVSQIPKSEEKALRVITEVVNLRSGKRVPVTVQFITKCATWAYSLNDCPYCEQLRRFEEEARTLNPSPYLLSYVQEAADELQPKDLDTVRREQEAGIQLSLESEYISPVRMARFRELMRDVESSNSAREILAAQIRSLSNISSNTQVCERLNRVELITLLGAEWTRLSQLPLEEADERDIAAIAADVAEDNSLTEYLRRSGIVVLRTISGNPDIFAHHFPNLLLAVLNRPKMVQQLLYCAFTLVEGCRIIPDEKLPRIFASMGQASDMVRRTLDKAVGGTDLLKVIGILGDMYASGLYRWRMALTKQARQSDSWTQIKLLFGESYDVHDSRCKSVANLFIRALDDALTDKDIQLPPMPWDNLLKQWEENGEPFLLSDVLPILSQLRSLFNGRYVRDKVGLKDSTSLAEAEHRNIRQNMNLIRQRLLEFSQHPERVKNSELWESFKQSRDFIWNLVVSPGGSVSKVSALLRIFDGCPYDLKELPRLIQSVLDSFRARGNKLEINLDPFSVPQNVSTLVFCHEQVIFYCIEQIFDNLIKHRLSGIASPDMAIRVGVVVEKKNGHIRINIMNEGTKAGEQVKEWGGLSRCKEYLGSYGATMDREQISSPWTFSVHTQFEEA